MWLIQFTIVINSINVNKIISSVHPLQKIHQSYHIIEYSAHFFHQKLCWNIASPLYLEGNINHPYSKTKYSGKIVKWRCALYSYADYTRQNMVPFLSTVTEMVTDEKLRHFNCFIRQINWSNSFKKIQNIWLIQFTIVINSIIKKKFICSFHSLQKIPHSYHIIEYSAHFFHQKWCWNIASALYLEGNINQPYS